MSERGIQRARSWLLLPVAIVAAVALGGSSGSPVVDPGPVGRPGGSPSAAESTASALPHDLAVASADPSADGSGVPAATPVGSASPSKSSVPTVIPSIQPTRTALPAETPHPTVRPTPGPTPATTLSPPTPGPTAAAIPPLSACAILPATNVWNRRVDALPVAADSDTMIAAIGLDASLHPDFSATGYGIPYNVVGASTPRSTVTFDYADESDPGPYPIPAKPKIEGGSDAHLLMVDTNSCTLYELYATARAGTRWTAGSGAIWALGSNALRPDGWTSADAAGLPIFPGLVRYSEVAAGAINHAIRFTAPRTCAGYVYPARHKAGSGSCTTYPPMGLRVRLKASVDLSGFGPQAQVVLRALQRYGMLLADNGSPWYITGAPDSRWNDDELHHLGSLTGADFEVVDTSGFANGG